MVTDYDTSHELRAAEIRNLQNSFEEEISMVSLTKLFPIQPSKIWSFELGHRRDTVIMPLRSSYDLEITLNLGQIWK